MSWPSARTAPSTRWARWSGTAAGAETDAGLGEPARFRGTLTGKTLTLTVTLVGPSQDLGTFKLKQGRPGRLAACPVPPAG